MKSTRALVFLDFDGVLNSSEFEHRVPKSQRRPNLDPRAVRRLNDLVRRTDAAIVFSTAWRIDHTPEKLSQKLVKVGFKYPGRVLGATPDFDGKPRGDEIQWWRTRSQARKELPLVILDDLEDMEDLVPFLVRTDPEVGLTRRDVELAVEILRAQAR